MLEQVKKLLINYSKKNITLSELESLTKRFVTSYDDFAQTVIKLEEEEVIAIVKAKGRSTRPPQLAFQYKINKSKLLQFHHQELQQYRHILHSFINIDDYYSEDPTVWKRDLPYIQLVDKYIKEHGFPHSAVPAPERSFELVGDEKWIVEKGGKELLEKINVFDRLQIIPVSDPLMFAINPINLMKQTQYHLIVENKTTYQGLLPILSETSFSTLIYGCGKKVIKSIEQFDVQYPVKADHIFFYFGDLDREGIAIWHSLNNKIMASLAMPFYEACLLKEPSNGKEYQRDVKEALTAFLRHFSKEQQQIICQGLHEGLYFPQEILKTKELQQIWRVSNWTV